MKMYEKAPAKINLMLDVLRKRADGFHEVEMIMTMVDLADRLELSELKRDSIIISSQAGYIPLDEKNLAFQAARLIKDRYNVKSGVHIHLDKRVPVAAGLPAAAVMPQPAARPEPALAAWYSFSGAAGARSRAWLRRSVLCHRRHCSGYRTGEKLTPIPNPPQCWVILAKPPINVSTAEVYGRVRANQIAVHPSASGMQQAIEAGDFGAVCAGLGNVLEDVTLKLHPEVQQLKEAMVKLGADGVLMSGSGPTVFGLVSKQSKVARIYNGLRGFCKEVYAVRSLT